MKRGLSKRWQLWRHNTTNLAESLALKYSSGKLPVPLREIANSRHVKEVVFRPLMIDGCTAVEDDGFVIYVRCEEREVEDLHTRWNSVSDGGRSLSARMRFTIAHEITHTFFFDLDGPFPRSKINVEHNNTIRSLERECNRAATRILLPDVLLRTEVKNVDLLDPMSVLELRKKFGVSVACFLNRLRRSSVWDGNLGAIAHIQVEDGEYRIGEIIIHPHLQRVFPRAKKGHPAMDFIYCPSLTLYGGVESRALIDVPALVGTRRVLERFEVVCQRVAKHSTNFLLTVCWKGQQQASVQ